MQSSLKKKAMKKMNKTNEFSDSDVIECIEKINWYSLTQNQSRAFGSSSSMYRDSLNELRSDKKIFNEFVYFSAISLAFSIVQCYLTRYTLATSLFALFLLIVNISLLFRINIATYASKLQKQNLIDVLVEINKYQEDFSNSSEKNIEEVPNESMTNS